MAEIIHPQKKRVKLFYVVFAVATLAIMMYYLSYTLFYFTSPYQFPINSFERFPLTYLIFPAEVFSFLFSLYFMYNLLGREKNHEKGPRTYPQTDVAILLPVYNEPKEIVERTVQACKNVRWHKKVNIYLLDDSTDETDMKNMDKIAKTHGLSLLRRKGREGYKAGNINHAVSKHIKEEFFVILDSDQAPEPDFLSESMHYFSDPFVAFAQSPQFFVGGTTPLQRAAKIGSNIFYRAQATSKDKDDAIPFCGTNVVVRKKVFERVNGFSYYTATEDIDLGIRMNALGFKGRFIPKVLAKGYVPADFKSYMSQQYRWANGNLAILRENWKRIFGGNFPLRYQIHMLFTTAWWLIGIVTLLYITVPMLSLLFGMGTHHSWLPTAILMFLFFHVMLGIFLIYASLKFRVYSDDVTLSDALLQYSLITNSLFIYTRAAFNALILKRYVGFIRTDKRGSATGLSLIKWNLILGTIAFVLSLVSIYYTMLSSEVTQVRSYLSISLWLLFYGIVLLSSILFVGGKS